MKAKNRPKPSGSIKKSRKQQRKEMRKQKKARRNEYYTNRKVGKHVANPDISKPNMNPAKRIDDTITKPKNVQKILTAEEQQRKTLQKEKREHEKLKKDMAKQRKEQLQKANDEEDRNIKRLEKQLRLNKRKSKTTPKSFSADGLDYLLEVCDSDNMKAAVEAEQQLTAINDDFEEDLALMTGKSLRKGSKDDLDSDIDIEDAFDNSEEEESDGSEEENPGSEAENSGEEEIDGSDDEINNIEEMDFSDEEISTKVIKASGKSKKNQKGIENITTSKRKKIKNASLTSDENNDDAFVSNDDDDVTNDDVSMGDDDDMNDDDDISEGNIDEDDHEKKADKDNEVWEDIYGRLRGKDGKIITENQGKYIPPAIRAKMEAESSTDKKREEKLNRLRRQLKGLLNRLAESNMHSIASQVEELYMNNSRNDMNDTLTSLIFDSVVTPILTPERLLLEHIVLVTILHANVGTEVGAHFLQNVVRKFDELYNAGHPVENKMLDNVVWIIAQLYNYKVFHAHLMYEILTKLSNRFSEADIECILLILKSVGFSMRKDDPLALKNLILSLQKQANNASSEVKENPRVKFMLDILLAIKNNNMSKIPNYDTTYSEHLKKLLKGFIRKGSYVTTLSISLEDLLHADECGKWWVVGSAWTGKTTESDQGKGASNKLEGFSQKLLDLARKQRMNTDTRRNVFCIIMSAEDYVDAFEKLLHLGLKNQQEREIVHVILHCCLQEKAFNPYYAVLAQKFCQYDRKFQMTIKYSVWDKLKALTECSVTQLSNLAKLLTHLFLERGLPISTLKIVQFGDLDKITLRFMRQILIGILLCEDEEVCQGVFTNVAQSDKLKMFRESLRLFIQHFLLRNLKSEAVPEEQRKLLEDRSKMVDKILSISDKKVRF